MDIADWRKKIDELDRRLVELLSQRAQAAQEIGRLKRNTSLPVYEPEREQAVFSNVQQINSGPLPNRELVRIYERIMDVMRNIQKDEIVPRAGKREGAETELEPTTLGEDGLRGTPLHGRAHDRAGSGGLAGGLRHPQP